MLAYHGVRVLDEIPIGGHFIERVIPDGSTCACKIVEEESIGSSFVAMCERRCCGGPSLACVGGWWTGRPVLLGDGEDWCDWWGQPSGWGGVPLGAFEMVAELPLIEFFAVAVAVTVFDFVILVDGVKRDYFAFMESSVCNPFTDDHTIWENSNVCWEGDHPLNRRDGHPLSSLGGGL